MNNKSTIIKIVSLAVLLQTFLGIAAGESCPIDLRTQTTVAEGCKCNPAAVAEATNFGMCRNGYVCADPWAGDLLRQELGASPAPNPTLTPLPTWPINDTDLPEIPSDLPVDAFVCNSCAYGQYCPQGSFLPPVYSPLIQLAIARLSCPSGKFCPTPGESYDCTPGSYCAAGSVTPVTCNMTVLVKAFPTLIMPSRPTTMYESVYVRGTQMAGNQCPANSTTPATACKGGYYCPTPSQSVICPEGHFCKEGSQAPSKCPVLTSCPEGSAKATLSGSGFIMLAGVLIILWTTYLLVTAALSINQRKLARTQTARERLWKLLNPLFASQQHSRSQAFRAFKSIRPKINIEFDNLGLTLHDGTPILSGVTGRFAHSRVSAIMGPSGAGKSTFLNVIMGKARSYGKVTGRMRANGREMRADELSGIIGFVPQEDIVHEDLTVRENLVYSARLRLSAAKPLKEQLAIVDDVINVLQLRHVQHSLVGSAERRGISGGQRKRVNIGMELAAKPSVLFMDEPTSGLDATAAADILAALKRMANLGMNIITVIHQPRFSIFTLFDDAMLLCKGGKLAYLGPSQLALPYFESLGFALPPNENPADFAMDVLSGSIPRENSPNFQPEDLVPLWESSGLEWTTAQEAAGLVRIVAASSGGAPHHGNESVDPEQLRVLEQAFDAADGDGDSAIDGAGLRALLQGLGLEPAPADVEMIRAELADPRSGLIQKDEIMQYVRWGGRPPTADANSPSGGGSKRRIDSLYRVYSIEQYSLGSALAEMAAASMPAALRADPSITLKDMAAAAMERPSSSQSSGSAASVPTEQQAKEGAPVIQTIPEEEIGALGSPTLVSVASLHLPDASSTAPSSPGPASKNAQQRGEELRRASMELNRNASMLGAGDEPTQRSWSWRVLALFGLEEAGSGQLRSTPGLFGQVCVLVQRAAIKWARNWTTRFTDLLLLMFAAVACGAMHGTGTGPADVRGHTALTMLTLGILSATTSLAVFSKDRMVFWRERASGIGVLPHFIANTALNLVDVALHPLIFLSIYNSMTLRPVDFEVYYLIGLLVVWWCSSAGCLISVLVGNTSSALVASVAIVMIAGGFLNGVSPSYRNLDGVSKILTSISYNRWAVEAMTIATYQHYPRYTWPLTKALMNIAGYCGLDAMGIPSIAAGSGGSVPDIPAISVPRSVLEEQDISVYCAGYLTRALVVIALEGLILRLATLLALYVCPRGITLEPLVVALSALVTRVKAAFKRKPKRRTLTPGGPAGKV